MQQQLPLFRRLKLHPQKPQRIEVKERWPIHVVTWECPDTGRFWKRTFPQTKAMKDWKGERNFWRCLKNLAVSGTSYTIQQTPRTAYIWS